MRLQPFLSLVLGAVSAALLATVFAAPALNWPGWVPELAVAALFVLVWPLLANILTGSRSTRWFKQLRRPRWWVVVYVSAWTAICAPRLHWPPATSWLCGALALLISTCLVLESRLRRRFPGDVG